MFSTFRKSLIFLFVASVFVGGCGSGDRRVSFRQYPEMKLGFTTQNFIKVVPVSVESAKMFVSYARSEGYAWMELRDPDASLTPDECEEIAAFARANGVEVVYSAQRGLLDGDFMEIFDRAITNAAAFDGPRWCRVLVANSEYHPNRLKYGWTKEEFEKAVAVANQAAGIAKANGFMLAAENSNGDIDGRDKPYYGLAEFFDAADEGVLWQFDTANFFWVPQAKITPAAAEEFLRKYASRLSYIHLKSAKDGKALPVLDGNPLDFETIFAIADDNGCRYIAIELDAITDERQIYKNQSKSLRYLMEVINN